LLLIFLAVNFLVQALPARPADTISELNGRYFKKILKDTGMILSSPGSWEKKDWFRFGLSLAATSAFFPLDNSIHRQVYEHESPTLTSVSRAFSFAGAPLGLLGMLSAGYLIGHFKHSASTRATFLLAGESLLITELFVKAGKIGIGRARPYTLEGPFAFNPVTLQGQWQSFPSGHSAAAWAVATSLASRVKSPYLRATFFAIASGISLSRIFLDKHFASDVVGSALLGYFIARKLSKPESPEKKANRATLSFNLGHRFLAFGLSYQF
jgi:membrane-associated phospholipid phosphatase